GAPAGNVKVAGASTAWSVPGCHVVHSASPTRTRVGSATPRVTSVSTDTCVWPVNVGGAGSPSAPAEPEPPAPPVANTANSTNVGAAMANSLNQYWHACTTVMARMPPPMTL